MRTCSLSIAGLDTTIVRGETQAALTVVLLHGFSMRADDLVPFTHALRVPATFLLPNGPLPVPAGGFAWWDVDAEVRAHSQRLGPRDLASHRPEGRAEARRQLLAWLNGLPPMLRNRPLVLAGFSQGGMLLADTLMMEQLAADALALLSSSRIAMDDWRPRLSRLAGLPVFISHGHADSDLAYAAGKELAETLAGGGAAVTFVDFPGGHEIPLVVWRKFRSFLLRLCEIAPGRTGGISG